MNRLCGIGLETIWTLGLILAQLLLIEPETFLESTDLKALESKYLYPPFHQRSIIYCSWVKTKIQTKGRILVSGKT